MRHYVLWLLKFLQQDRFLQQCRLGELIFQQELEHAGVIFFRLPGASLQTKIEHLNTVLEDYADKLRLGDFIVVTPGQIRVASRLRAA